MTFTLYSLYTNLKAGVAAAQKDGWFEVGGGVGGRHDHPRRGRHRPDGLPAEPDHLPPRLLPPGQAVHLLGVQGQPGGGGDGEAALPVPGAPWQGERSRRGE